MTTTINTLNAAELNLIAGGVIEGPDGKGCTEHGTPKLDPSGHELHGGPVYIGGFGN